MKKQARAHTAPAPKAAQLQRAQETLPALILRNLALLVDKTHQRDSITVGRLVALVIFAGERECQLDAEKDQVHVPLRTCTQQSGL